MTRLIIRLLVTACLTLACIVPLRAGTPRIVTGAEQTDLYLPLLRNRRVAVFSNHTGRIGDRHLLDVLLEEQIRVVAIFSPEHGFRGDADAGEHVAASVDPPTGVPILSLYDGKTPRPGAKAMEMFDLLVVDIQDVGLRFYTYYITLCRLMDACAEYRRPVVLLDRPNPNGHCVDGPLLDMKYKSGVGALPIPVLHGMTLGELALMVNGEGWLPHSRVCDLKVIPCRNYTHRSRYRLPVAPSPNLPDMQSVYLYPSLCLFEGTPLSLGRGTAFPFQVYGHPDMKGCTFSFTPRSTRGAKHPPLQDKECHGVDLRHKDVEEILAEGLDLSYLIDAYRRMGIGEKFFTPFFEKLIGTDTVRRMILEGHSADEIEASWHDDIVRFKQQRRPYLLYEE